MRIKALYIQTKKAVFHKIIKIIYLSLNIPSFKLYS